ncbi:MAG: hypothetical protein BWY43_00460 [candidate division WS2 bacterium ADurb.Bin280]|uniref:Rod shape-determining protein MreD n=1 Tax=candidate division WS2 bacterium ADurb.Bin280 TaxID=1852829 RepID=A0A1V5SDI3_9BACT|nr:MAG: hypothetical protein BWY43_00460 [candidate division WS2 bacterium ADurb.Bin280]
MNSKIFFIILSVFFAVIDLALSGKFELMRFVFLFPAFLFIISTRYKIEIAVLSGLIYSFLYDISSSSQIPYVSFFVLFVICVSYLIRGKFVDLKNQAVVFFVYVTVNFLICAASIVLSSDFVSFYSFTKFTIVTLLIHAAFFPLWSFAVNRLDNFFINEKSTQ